MLHFGDEGYSESARKFAEIYKRYQEVVARISGIRLLCPCHASIVPIASYTHNIYSIASLMEEKGWNLFTGQMPPVLSICIGERHDAILPAFEADLGASVKHLEANPNYK